MRCRQITLLATVAIILSITSSALAQSQPSAPLASGRPAHREIVDVLFIAAAMGAVAGRAVGYCRGTAFNAGPVFGVTGSWLCSRSLATRILMRDDILRSTGRLHRPASRSDDAPRRSRRRSCRPRSRSPAQEKDGVVSESGDGGYVARAYQPCDLAEWSRRRSLVALIAARAPGLKETRGLHRRRFRRRSAAAPLEALAAVRDANRPSSRPAANEA
jgi:hypothetical protein